MLKIVLRLCCSGPQAIEILCAASPSELSGIMALQGHFQLAISLVLLSVIWKYVKRRQRSRRASKLACGSVPSVPMPWWDMIGIQLIKYTLKARREHKTIPRISELFQHESKRLNRSVSTMLVNSIAGNTILTFSPDNMKAGLATQVADFEIGDDRVAVFGMLLGTGIVSVKRILWTSCPLTVTSSRPRAPNGSTAGHFSNRHSTRTKSAKPHYSTSTTET